MSSSSLPPLTAPARELSSLMTALHESQIAPSKYELELEKMKLEPLFLTHLMTILYNGTNVPFYVTQYTLTAMKQFVEKYWNFDENDSRESAQLFIEKRRKELSFGGKSIEQIEADEDSDDNIPNVLVISHDEKKFLRHSLLPLLSSDQKMIRSFISDIIGKIFDYDYEEWDVLIPFLLDKCRGQQGNINMESPLPTNLFSSIHGALSTFNTISHHFSELEMLSNLSILNEIILMNITNPHSSFSTHERISLQISSLKLFSSLIDSVSNMSIDATMKKKQKDAIADSIVSSFSHPLSTLLQYFHHEVFGKLHEVVIQNEAYLLVSYIIQIYQHLYEKIPHLIIRETNGENVGSAKKKKNKSKNKSNNNNDNNNPNGDNADLELIMFQHTLMALQSFAPEWKKVLLHGEDGDEEENNDNKSNENNNQSKAKSFLSFADSDNDIPTISLSLKRIFDYQRVVLKDLQERENTSRRHKYFVNCFVGQTVGNSNLHQNLLEYLYIIASPYMSYYHVDLEFLSTRDESDHAQFLEEQQQTVNIRKESIKVMAKILKLGAIWSGNQKTLNEQKLSDSFMEDHLIAVLERIAGESRYDTNNISLSSSPTPFSPIPFVPSSLPSSLPDFRLYEVSLLLFQYLRRLIRFTPPSSPYSLDNIIQNRLSPSLNYPLEQNIQQYLSSMGNINQSDKDTIGQYLSTGMNMVKLQILDILSVYLRTIIVQSMNQSSTPQEKEKYVSYISSIINLIDSHNNTNHSVALRIQCSKMIGDICNEFSSNSSSSAASQRISALLSPYILPSTQSICSLLISSSHDSIVKELLESLLFCIELNDEILSQSIDHLLPLLIKVWEKHSKSDDFELMGHLVEVIRSILEKKFLYVEKVVVAFGELLMDIIDYRHYSEKKYLLVTIDGALQILLCIVTQTAKMRAEAKNQQEAESYLPNEFYLNFIPPLLCLLLHETQDDHISHAMKILTNMLYFGKNQILSLVKSNSFNLSPWKEFFPSNNLMELFCISCGKYLTPDKDLPSSQGAGATISTISSPGGDVGILTSALIMTCGDVLGNDTVSTLLRAAIIKFLSTDSHQVKSSLVIVLAQLLSKFPPTMILSLIQSFGSVTIHERKIHRNIKAGNAYATSDDVHSIWEEKKVQALPQTIVTLCETMNDSLTPYETRVSLFALSRLLFLGDNDINSLPVKGDLIIEEAKEGKGKKGKGKSKGMSTRSSGTPQFEEIPFALKVVKIMLASWVSEVENKKNAKLLVEQNLTKLKKKLQTEGEIANGNHKSSHLEDLLGTESDDGEEEEEEGEEGEEGDDGDDDGIEYDDEEDLDEFGESESEEELDDWVQQMSDKVSSGAYGNSPFADSSIVADLKSGKISAADILGSQYGKMMIGGDDGEDGEDEVDENPHYLSDPIYGMNIEGFCHSLIHSFARKFPTQNDFIQSICNHLNPTEKKNVDRIMNIEYKQNENNTGFPEDPFKN